ncbi:ATP-binding protein [Halorubrum vacuolatum]
MRATEVSPFGAARMSLDDDGPGIDADVHDHLFVLGYTTHPDGSGYDLSIVNQIGHAHGWTISCVESTDGGARCQLPHPTSLSLTTSLVEGGTCPCPRPRTRLGGR